MAKKKAAADAAPPSPKAIAKPVATKKPIATNSASSAATSEKAPALSIEEIGHAAGAVWQALDANGGLSVAALKKASGCSADLTMAAVGWLAREGKLVVTANGRSSQIELC
ncbi:MAG: winged helix-turn-helix domain-containing protein [Pirellulales bacterium]|nr:winged helix-turn-helix domain-containing protein [Pirellulales bacterium]